MRTHIAVAGVLCTLLVGCGGSSSTATSPEAPRTRSLDTGKVAQAITASIRNQRNVEAQVRCPKTVKQAKGVSFVCTATSQFGDTEFVVTQKDDAGNVRYVAADQ